ncbi:hypothetical protein FVF58_00895 [Paraburkholderia panacisoli]|uniref:Uncharacterized protein n=1 Tax=Paraburkholderia panacisoli TaxID=2603818 RepID=A0A5B0HMC9_9BURK|nr:hypothetical protein [Paraburkholderia panacisoli]KAA1015943.1 hypothetical protein FVF58_00895 [Paraburkholderia panacisoli]
MTETETIDVLAARIAANLAKLDPHVPLGVALWDIETIAAYLKRSPESTRNRIVCLPGFPQVIRLPGEKPGARSRPLWKAIEVIRWAESYRNDHGPKAAH